MQTALRKLKVLFFCTGNSCRSQMAEGWARALKGDCIEAYSAGMEKHGMNLHAAKAMAEAGLDISRQHSKLLAEIREGKEYEDEERSGGGDCRGADGAGPDGA
jgi:arsenate reductase